MATNTRSHDYAIAVRATNAVSRTLLLGLLLRNAHRNVEIIHSGATYLGCIHDCRNRSHMQGEYVYLVLLYILATSQGLSGRVPTCDSAHSWCGHSACCPTGIPHYPNTLLTSPCPILFGIFCFI